MKHPQLAVVALAAVLSAGMLLYPPYMMALTGGTLGYHFAPQLPAMVATFGVVDTGRLLMQLAGVWGVATGALLALHRRKP